MGSAIMKENVEQRKLFEEASAEYEKMKAIGMSPDEIYQILVMRLSSANMEPKDDDIRTAENVKDLIKPQPLKTNLALSEKVDALEKRNKVLIVDDSPIAHQICSRLLSTNGFGVLEAYSALEGYELLKKNSSDVKIVFLDVVMPSSDGLECLSWIKKDPIVSHIPVYMLSGLEDETLSEVCVDNGAKGMLLKPLRNDILQKIILDLDNFENKVVEGKSSDVNSNQSFVLDIEMSSLSPSSISSCTSNFDVGRTVTDFILLDQNSHQTKFSSQNLSVTLLVFVPTINSNELYGDTGFLTYLIKNYDPSLKTNVICISIDLPDKLLEAQKKFKIPFQLLSDPSLTVSRAYVGSFDYGCYLKQLKNGSLTNQINSTLPSNFEASNVGLLLIDQQGCILKKWVAKDEQGQSCPSLLPSNFREFLSERFALKPASRRNSCDSDIISIVSKSEVIQKTSKISKTVSFSCNPSVAEFSPEDLSLQITKNFNQNSTCSVLVVDDSSVSSRIVSKKLEAMGYSVVVAYNGRQAYDVLKKNPSSFDIVLADLVMPVMNGFQLAQLIRSDCSMNHIKIAFLTGANFSSEDLSPCGAIGVMKKPFDDLCFKELLSVHEVVPVSAN